VALTLSKPFSLVSVLLSSGVDHFWRFSMKQVDATTQLRLLFLRGAATVALITHFTVSVAFAQNWQPGSLGWEYNAGPDPKTPHGRELIDILAEMPEYSAISEALMEEQKFRYIFGLMMTRTDYDPNSVKILFIGQDATHIAEAAKQPGTSGFGARVQSIGNYFGVDQGVSTTNAFLSTIKGQYGAFDHIYVETDSNGRAQIRQSAYVENELWLAANGEDSEIRIKREQFWEWMIKNNPESLRLMVLFGGAARDAFAEFLIKRGAKVGTRLDPERLKSIQVPETRLVYAGGNNEFPVPITKDGKDIYQILVGRRLDYSKPEDQKEAVEALRKSGQKGIDMMVFTGGGQYGSGVISAAQLGGYDLEKVEINGQRTNSLKGLKLSDGSVVSVDIAFIMSPHPSSLSKMTPSAASSILRKAFESLRELVKKGWRIEPDLDDRGRPLVNQWLNGEDYRYGRADIRQGYFEFGAPDDRRVSRADASRLDAQVIVAGTRDRVQFDRRQIEAMKKATPAEYPNANELWSGRFRDVILRYIFDRGPGEETARLIMSNLDRDLIFEPKPGMKVVDRRGDDITFETHGIDAYYTKTHPGTGFFGIHRGSFENSRALILADPHGIDDWLTSRALTGDRGQHLHGLMRDLGFNDQYLVIKTAPVGMDGATAEEWEVTRQRTEAYREAAIRRALELSRFELILTDGEIAAKEMSRILGKLGVSGIPVVNIRRESMVASSGIKAAGEAIRALDKKWASAKINVQRADIPRTHLTFWSRIWEGTSGDRVLDAQGKHRGGVRAVIAPDWVAKQKVPILAKTKQSIEKMLALLEKLGLRADREPIQKFIERKGLNDVGFSDVENQRRQNLSPKLAPVSAPVCRDLFTGRAS